MPDFAFYAAKMDAQAYQRLGDSISYSFDGGATWADIKVFPADREEGETIAGLEPLPRRKRVKVSMAIVARPSTTQHRLRFPGDAATYRPRTKSVQSAGRDWLFEVEKV